MDSGSHTATFQFLVNASSEYCFVSIQASFLVAFPLFTSCSEINDYTSSTQWSYS